MQPMNAVPASPAEPQSEHWACEFDRLRAQLRPCSRRSRRRVPPMAGIEVAYVALAEWLAAGGGPLQQPGRLHRRARPARQAPCFATRLACPEGLEPPTCCLEGSCSIQLSYGQLAVGKMVGVR